MALCQLHPPKKGERYCYDVDYLFSEGFIGTVCLIGIGQPHRHIPSAIHRLLYTGTLIGGNPSKLCYKR